MKKILFLLLLTASANSQALFDKGIKITGGIATENTATKLVVQSADNALNTISKSDLLSGKEDTAREKTIYNTTFQSISDLSVMGAFTIVSDGLKSPSTGTFGSTYAIWNKKTVIDKDVTRAIVTVNNASSIFGLIRKPSVSVEAGTKANINGATNTITIYNGWDGTNTALASSVSATIPFSLVVGKKYLIELEKLSSGTKTFSITDISNQQTIKITSNNEVNSFSGSCWDAPGVSFESGDVTFKTLSYGSVYNPKPLVMISGDSFTEGNSLVDFGLGAYDKRWAYLIYGALQNDAVISGRGGESAGGLLLRNDTDFFKPKYHLFLIGANDVDFNVWKTNYDAFIAKVLANGSIPLLATIAPRADRQAFINQANAYIKTLPYKVINFAKAISLNNDEVTLNPAYYMPDNVHPNLIGHNLMFNQVKIDFPTLFDKDNELHNTVVKGTLKVTSLIDAGTRTLVVNNGIVSSVENGVTGTGTANFMPKYTSLTGILNSQFFDNGTNTGVGTSNPLTKFNIDKGGQNKSSSTPTGGLLISDAIVGGTQRSIELGTDTDNGIGYLQARSTLSATWYALALNPNGGAVSIGDNLQVNGAATFSSSVTANSLAITTAPITSTGTPPLLTYNAATKAIESVPYSTFSRPYKVYSALLTQTGTAAPTVSILENTLGGTVVLARTGVGSYTASLTGAFTLDKTACLAQKQASGSVDGFLHISRTDNNTVTIVTALAGGSSDGIMNGATIEIRVYN
jgi:hypothetical protein